MSFKANVLEEEKQCYGQYKGHIPIATSDWGVSE